MISGWNVSGPYGALFSAHLLQDCCDPVKCGADAMSHDTKPRPLAVTG
jgi:hypothetical protein